MSFVRPPKPLQSSPPQNPATDEAPCTGGQRDWTPFVTAVFKAWNAAKIPFVVLRNHDDLPARVQNDLDILVPPGQLHLAEQILVQSAATAGFTLHNRAEFVPVCLYLHDPTTQMQLQVDLFGCLGYRMLDILPAQDVLDRRQARGLIVAPHPVDEAIVNLLTTLLYNGRVKEKYRSAIQQTVREATGSTRERLTASFGSQRAAFLVESVLTDAWDSIERKASELRRALLVRHLLRRPAHLLARLLNDLARLVRRAWQSPGLSIAFMGPDGCGKSTVIPRVIHRLQHTFPPGKGLLIHWKPTVFFRSRRKSGIVVTDPHARPPRPPVASLAYLAFHWTEFLLGSLTQIQPVRFRNGLAVTDRSYYDFLVDPRRYRLKLPAWIVRLGAAFLPKPDLIFVLDAPTDVLQSRKQEVPAEETERQRVAFRALANSLNNGHVVDASQSPDAVTESVVQTVLEHLASRGRSR